MSYTAGLDIGSSGAKCTVFNEKADVIAAARRTYSMHTAPRGICTLNPEELRKACLGALVDAGAKLDAGQKVEAVSISSLGESFVCLDECNRPLFDIMIYIDRRGSEELQALLDQIGGKALYDTTGCYPDPMYAIVKLRYLRKAYPAVLEKTRKICFIADYIGYLLSGEFCCEYSLAGRSSLFSISAKQWWEEGTSFATIEREMLPEPVSAGTITGKVTENALLEIGDAFRGCRVVLGGHDQILAVIGSGANRPGDVVDGLGTVDCLTAIVGEEVDREKLLSSNMPMVPFLDRQSYATYAFNMSGGINNAWFRRELCKDLPEEDAFELLGEEAPGRPTDLLFLPYLGGGGTPDMDDKTPAAITGLRLHTTRGELFRGFLEGGAYEMRRNLKCLADAEVQAKRVFAVGGASGSRLLTQIRADVFGMPVEIPSVSEAGTLANAILCNVALGEYFSLEEAQRAMIRKGFTCEPEPSAKAFYDVQFEKYCQFYHRLKELSLLYEQ